MIKKENKQTLKEYAELKLVSIQKELKKEYSDKDYILEKIEQLKTRVLNS